MREGVCDLGQDWGMMEQGALLLPSAFCAFVIARFMGFGFWFWFGDFFFRFSFFVGKTFALAIDLSYCPQSLLKMDKTMESLISTIDNT